MNFKPIFTPTNSLYISSYLCICENLKGGGRMPECVKCGNWFRLGTCIIRDAKKFWVAKCPYCGLEYVIPT